MKRLFHRRIFKPTLLAFATALVIVPAASAYPVIDPGPQAGTVFVQTKVQPLTDGWYTAALQQTRINRAKQHNAAYRPSEPISGHGPMLP
jgi:hypothetical protein